MKKLLAFPLLLAALAAPPASAQTSYTTPPRLQLSAFGIDSDLPVRCYRTWPDFVAAHRDPPEGPLVNGMGGFVDAPAGEMDYVVALTPNVCRRLLYPLKQYQRRPTDVVFGPIRNDPYPFGLAVFTFAHEIAHVWQWQRNRMWVFPPSAHQAVEEAADCQAARHFSAMAYALGLRGRQNFVLVREAAMRTAGYDFSRASLPACWRTSVPLTVGWDSP